MDNLPKDPPDENNPTPASSTGGPPPFGSNFNPHANPVDPNNPYSSQPPQNPAPDPPNLPDYPDNPHHSTYAEVADHKLRDSHGRFATDELPENPNPLISQTSIFKKIFGFISKLSIKKVIAILAFSSLTVSNPFFQNLVAHFFPNSSPILGRTISYQGVLKSSESGIYSLALPDSSIYTIHFKPSTALANLKKLNEVVVKGNLTWTPYVIENAEIYPLNFVAEDSSQKTSTPRSLGEVEPNTPNLPNSPNLPNLPKLYSLLTWEVTQSKTLLFTSGKRRIEQEGVYLESSQVIDIPQDFINYYTNQLTSLGFKQTLNSSEPNGITITYSKDDLFLTFGIKNIYSGSGDNKKIAGYKAYIEHN